MSDPARTTSRSTNPAIQVHTQRVDDSDRPAALDSDAFRAFVEHAADGILIVDRHTATIVDLNETACEFAGKDRATLIGHPIDRLVPEWSETSLWETFLDQHLPRHEAGDETQRLGDADRIAAFATDRPRNQYRFRRDHNVQGRIIPRYYEVAARALDTNSEQNIVLSVRDVTKTVNAEADRMRVGKDLLRIVQMLPDVVFSCEKRANGKIYWTLNEGKLAEEFGVTTKEIEGKSLEELFPGGASDQMKEHFEAAFRGETTEFINEMGGRHFKHYPQPVYGPDGRVAHVIGFISEVTNLVEAETKIRHLNRALEQRIDELAAANEGLEAFSYTVSHDLRTPLAVIDTLAQTLGRSTTATPERQALIGDKIRDAVRKMGTLIDDVLTLSRAGRTEVDPQRCDLAQLALQAITELQTNEPDRATLIDIQGPLPANADPGLARIVIDNLVRNAWKYTAKEDLTTIVIRAQEERRAPDGHVVKGPVFIIEDNGIGFDPREAAHLFGSFARAEGAQDFEGSGIGLATVNRIINRHGGTIWAEGEPGRGARFCFTFSPSDDGGRPS